MSKKFEEGFKVLTLSRRSTYWQEDSPGSMRYPVTFRVERMPKWGPLAVFETRSDACQFAGPFSELYYMVVPCLFKRSRARCFWAARDWGDADFAPLLLSRRDGFPTGTAFADAVICLE